MEGQRGQALLLATVLGIVAMSTWALAFLTTRDLIRTEKLVRLRAERDAGVTRALAVGLRLLRTGYPPEEPYECIVVIADDSEERHCTVTFDREFGSDQWTIDVHESTDADRALLPEAPETFAEEEDDDEPMPGDDDDGDDDDDDDDADDDDDDDDDEKKAKKNKKDKNDKKEKKGKGSSWKNED